MWLNLGLSLKIIKIRTTHVIFLNPISKRELFTTGVPCSYGAEYNFDCQFILKHEQ